MSKQGVDLSLAKDVFEEAQRFFARPMKEKMQVCTDLMPEEFCGYHPMERYNWEGTKHKGEFQIALLIVISLTPICRPT